MIDREGQRMRAKHDEILQYNRFSTYSESSDSKVILKAAST